MKNLMHYKDYYGTVEYSEEDDTLFGQIAFIRDAVTYEAEDIKTLKQEFYNAVDDYIETCKKLGKQPNKTCKGSFNVRVGESLHCKAAIYAEQHKTNLNNVVKEALEKYIA